MQTKLKYLVGMFQDKDILVVSDKYPPEVIGGAELSLHGQLKELGKEVASKILVLTFSDRKEAYFSRTNGIDVLSLPTQHYWYEAIYLSKLYAYYLKLPKLIRSFFHLSLYTINAIKFGDWRKRILIARLARKGMVRGAVSKEFLPEFRAKDLKAIQYILEALKIKKLFCNNTRSILISVRLKQINPELWNSLEKIAYVRDQRFSCVRHNQSFYVKEKGCRSCNFSCAPLDCKQKPDKMRNYLTHLKLYRENAISSYDTIFVSSQYSKSLIEPLSKTTPIVTRNPIENKDWVYERIATTYQSVKNRVLIIGSISEPKGQLDFVKNSVSFLKKNKSYILEFAGRGVRIQSQIEAFAKKKGILSQLRFHGFKNRGSLFGIIAECSVVVSTSISPESFGRVPLEAAIAGRPFVGFDVGALRENVDHNVSGFLIEYRNYEAMHAAIQEVCENRIKGKWMADNAHKRLIEDDRLEKSAKQAFKAGLALS